METLMSEAPSVHALWRYFMTTTPSADSFADTVIRQKSDPEHFQHLLEIGADSDWPSSAPPLKDWLQQYTCVRGLAPGWREKYRTMLDMIHQRERWSTVRAAWVTAVVTTPRFCGRK